MGGRTGVRCHKKKAGVRHGALPYSASCDLSPRDSWQQQREETQPIRSRTGGSTFKNPEGLKAWELIDRAGCRGMTVGGAQMSEKHCNFIINTGSATAADLETLGNRVIEIVKDKTGVTLEWEIKRIGKA